MKRLTIFLFALLCLWSSQARQTVNNNLVQGIREYNAGRYASARNYFNNAPNADAYLALTDYAQGDYSRAIIRAKQALKRNDLDNELRMELNRVCGESLFKQSEPAQAMDYITKYLAECPDPMAAPLYIAGYYYYNKGDYAAATPLLHEAAAKSDGALRQSAQIYAAQALMDAGNSNAALEAYRKAADGPDAALARTAKINLRALAAKDKDEDIDSDDTVAEEPVKAPAPAAPTKKPVKPQKTNTDTLLKELRNARDAGEDARAVGIADALIARNSDIREAKFIKAHCLNNQGDSKQAISIWLDLAKDVNDVYGAQACYEAADAMNDDGRSNDALVLAQRFVKSNSPQKYWVARTFILISDIYSDKGDKAKSKEYLEALKKNYPGDDADIFMMIETRL